MAIVLDACAVIAYLRGETGADVIGDLLVDEDACYVHATNAYEVYLDFLRATGDQTVAEQAMTDLSSVGVIIREDMDAAVWQTAAHVKLGVRAVQAKASISVPDCFAVALAKKEGVAVVTSDHKEYRPVHDGGICPVRFFREPGLHLEK